MRVRLGTVRNLVREALLREAGPTGRLRKAGGKQQYKIGKVEDVNREISSIDANMMFDGAADAWAEIVPELYPDFPFADDPIAVKRRSIFFIEDGTLTVAPADMPQFMMARWDPTIEDWRLLDDED